MEPITISTIATTAILLLAHFLRSAGTELSKKAGGAAWDKTKQLFDAIKTKFSSQSTTDRYITDFTKSPNDARLQAMMRNRLETFMASDDRFAMIIASTLRDALNARADATFNVNLASDARNIIQGSTVYGGVGNTNITYEVSGREPKKQEPTMNAARGFDSATIGANIPVYDDFRMQGRQLGVIRKGTRVVLTGREGTAWTGDKTVEFRIVNDSAANWTLKDVVGPVNIAWTVWRAFVSEDNPHPKLRFGTMTDRFGFQWEVIWTQDNLVQATNLNSRAKKTLGYASSDVEADKIFEDYKYGRKDVTA